MGFCLEITYLHEIKTLFAQYPNLLTPDFDERIKHSIRVLHYQYLWGACKEARAILPKYHTDNLFNLIMALYNKRRKTYQANFLLLHCFENALRSTLAVEIAGLYNTNTDDWFLCSQSNNAKQNKLLKKITAVIGSKKSVQDFKNTFEIFDIFSLGDLQRIVSDYWGELAPLFNTQKIYKNQPLPVYGTKQSLVDKIDKIRKARNEIFHNKPTKIKFKKDLEILLLRLGYNLKDAITIGEIHNCIALKYSYESTDKRLQVIDKGSVIMESFVTESIESLPLQNFLQSLQKEQWREVRLGDVAEIKTDIWKVGDNEEMYIGLEHIVADGLRLCGIGSSKNISSNKFF